MKRQKNVIKNHYLVGAVVACGGYNLGKKRKVQKKSTTYLMGIL